MAFNHFDADGRAHMVDVTAKEKSVREATAEARVGLGPELLLLIQDRKVTKGDVLSVARLAGIAATKKTPDLIPLAHPLALHYAAIDFQLDSETGVVLVSCTVRAHDKTGVEMEAMTGAAVAALTIYDMCKAVSKDIEVNSVRLVRKSGGRSGTYERQDSAKQEE